MGRGGSWWGGSGGVEAGRFVAGRGGSWRGGAGPGQLGRVVACHCGPGRGGSRRVGSGRVSRGDLGRIGAGLDMAGRYRAGPVVGVRTGTRYAQGRG